LAAGQGVLRELASVLGLTLEEPKGPVEAESFMELARGVREDLLAVGKSELVEKMDVELVGETATGTQAEAVIELLLTVRDDLRAAREYELADTIRDGLASLGVIVEDGSEGSIWRVG
jgi:cysteinyl-tRNA synthetase